MAKQDSNDGCATAGGAVVVGIVVLIAAIPKPVWIVLGIVALAAVVVVVAVKATSAIQEHQAEAEKQARAERAAQAAAAERKRAAQLRKEKQRRVDTLGTKNAARVESAQAAVKQVGASEAARAGWLGDVDFSADIHSITESFKKSYALRKVAAELSALDNPSADDRRILTEAKSTVTTLEHAAIERVELIGKCATEARLIDKSLRTERKDAQTAEQRAELHGKLSAMLYGIEATPDTAPADSAADAVMARVQAYREIKNQIQRTRDSGT